jgi:hypothetical protein
MKSITIFEQTITIPEEALQNTHAFGRYDTIEKLLEENAPNILIQLQKLTPEEYLVTMIDIWEQLATDATSGIDWAAELNKNQDRLP